MTASSRRWLWLVVVLAALGTSTLRWPGAQRARPAADRTAPSETRLRLVEPPIDPNRSIDQRDPRVAGWLRRGSLEHNIKGYVGGGHGRTAVRPWIRTSVWIAQPVAICREDGSFDATVFIDPDYDHSFILTLEVEDSSAGRVLASYDYFLSGAESARKEG